MTTCVQGFTRVSWGHESYTGPHFFQQKHGKLLTSFVAERGAAASHSISDLVTLPATSTKISWLPATVHDSHKGVARYQDGG